MQGATEAPTRDSIQMWGQDRGRLQGGSGIEAEAGNGIGIEQVELGWLVGVMKGIPGESCVQSLEGRNHVVLGELKVIQSVWSIHCRIGKGSEVWLEIQSGDRSLSRPCQGAWI